MRKNTELMMSYLAGLVDGEGCIRIKKTQPHNKLTGRVNPGYHEAVQIRMVNAEAIGAFAEMFGGWYYKEKPHCKRGRPLYYYQATDKKAAEICRLLLPFLLIKREEAECLLALRKLKETQKRNAKGKRFTIPHAKTETPIPLRGRLLSDDAIAAREELYLRCKALKRA